MNSSPNFPHVPPPPRLGLRYLTLLPSPLLLVALVIVSPAYGAQCQGSFSLLLLQSCVNFPGQYWKGECYLFLYCVYFVLVC